MQFQILLTDTLFCDSPHAGDPACLCSRCEKVIEEKWVPIRAFTGDGGEYRYHPACVGITQIPLEEEETE